MDQPPVVRVADRVGELPHHSEPGREIELATVLNEVVVQPQRVGPLVDHQCRTHVVVEELTGHQQARVVEALAREKLPLRGVAY